MTNTIHTTHAPDGLSHDDRERVRRVLGRYAGHACVPKGNLGAHVDWAVKVGRIPADDRDAAYRACCKFVGVEP